MIHSSQQKQLTEFYHDLLCVLCRDVLDVSSGTNPLFPLSSGGLHLLYENWRRNSLIFEAFRCFVPRFAKVTAFSYLPVSSLALSFPHLVAVVLLAASSRSAASPFSRRREEMKRICRVDWSSNPRWVTDLMPWELSASAPSAVFSSSRTSVLRSPLRVASYRSPTL